MQNKDTLSVCHIVSGDLWAGAEVVVYNLLQSLKEYDDIRLTAVVLNSGELSRRIKDLGINVHIIDESSASFPALLSKLRHIIKENPPDIIHTHRYKENLLGYLASKSNHGVKLVATQHGSPETMGKAGSVKAAATTKLNFFLLAKCFDRVVAVSKTLAEELVHRYGIRPGKIETIHNGIPFPEIRNKEIHVDLFIIGSAGRFAPVKDYSLMVDIARSVSEKIDTVKFKLAGDGPELQKLQALVKEYGLSESFEFTGFINNLDSFYSGLDLYINTSFHEGIPMSVLEAMAQGLPVVAPKVGGFPEIITGGMEGYLIEGRNPAAFADKCILLASNNDLREEMSKAAQKKIENQFSADRMASRYYELYKMVASA